MARVIDSTAWRGLTLVRSLEFFPGRESGMYDVVLVLAASLDPASRAVRFSFRRVSKLRLHEFGGGGTQIVGLSIEDITDRQWDRLNFAVRDVENDRIELLCESYEDDSI